MPEDQPSILFIYTLYAPDYASKTSTNYTFKWRKKCNPKMRWPNQVDYLKVKWLHFLIQVTETF